MGIFLKAEWLGLVVINYNVPPEMLLPLLPSGTELDLWQGEALVSLVAFRFENTRVLGVKVPGHVNFEEVNLRFYVRRGERRGVAFVREFVPKPAITWVARNLYAEPYRTLPMSHRAEPKQLFYKWGEHSVTAHVGGEPQELAVGSEAEFILEHYWGYTRRSATVTSEYQVAHPRWRAWTPTAIELDVDFGACYGSEWSDALAKPWRSAMVAEGSEVEVFTGRRITT